ncbi:MAG: glycosyltransferase [Solidesulfovibrio sp.]|uniref:glycosyltransferase n=1 Tax=Solidesulfovibrio sp. TaxID=2910990 RepID=UPI003158A661
MPAPGRHPDPSPGGHGLRPLWALGVCLLALAACGPLTAGRAGYAACWLAAFGALAWLARCFPDWSRARAVPVLLGLGLGLRLVFVWAWPADSDVNRYVIEGALQLAGGNPYALAPGDARLWALLPETLRPVLAGVNHQELAAAYPPLAELYCRLVAAVSPTPLAFKAAAGLLDLLGCAVLAGWLWRRAASVSLLALAALNPLSLAMGAGEGHLDAAMLPLLALAVAAFGARRDGPGFLCLGAAGLIKYPALVLVFFFLRADNVRKAWLVLVPFLAFGFFDDGGGSFFSALFAFVGHTAHGGPVTALLWPVCGRWAPLCSLALGGAALAALWLAIQDSRRGPVAALVTVLACLPTVYPWYFLPLVPLWLARPTWAVWWLLAAQGLAATPTWLRPGGLGGEAAAMAAVWLPFAGLIVRGWFRPGLLVPAQDWPPVAGLSVVVPARNEAARLGACLAALGPAARAGEVVEVIVVDGGSRDATALVALAHGARLLLAGGGRGGQIAAGVAACRGEAVLVVHADCVCRADVPRRVLAAFRATPGLAGGAVGMRFAAGGPGLRLLEGLNALRARAFGISFGDQGQFFRRRALESVGGMPGMALMEDVELALRLRQAGETALCGGGLAVSPRRWEGGGFAAKLGRVLGLCGAYLAGRRLGLADTTGWRYFRRYYGRLPYQTET